MSNLTKTWLPLYLYCAEPWHKILVEAVKPVAQKIIEEGLAEKYFFIRYWERGPHIRLRFYGEEKILNTVLKPRLEKYFSTWFKNNPTTRREPTYPADYPKDEYWFPNDTIQWIEYEPETERYGGPEGIGIAEDHFFYCSDLILEELKLNETWSYEQSLGKAIQMHLSFATASGMDINEAKHFYDKIFQGWFPRAFFVRKEEGEEKLEKARKETLEAFENSFQNQKEGLFNYVETIWEGLESKEEFESEILNTWIQKVSETAKELHAANIIFPENFYKTNSELDIPEPRQKMWSIYSSYIHMINNRLGIFNQDEGFLGYLIIKCLALINEK